VSVALPLVPPDPRFSATVSFHPMGPHHRGAHKPKASCAINFEPHGMRQKTMHDASLVHRALRTIAISLELCRKSLTSRWTGIDPIKPLSRDQA
jgi:hypothetical protein